MRGVSDIGHAGTGDVEIRIQHAGDLERAQPLLRRSYQGRLISTRGRRHAVAPALQRQAAAVHPWGEVRVLLGEPNFAASEAGLPNIAHHPDDLARGMVIVTAPSFPCYMISRASIVVVGSVRYENHGGSKRAGLVMMRRDIPSGCITA